MKAAGEDGAKGDKGDTGATGAQGEKGEDGETPYIGENGNWWIGEADTGVKAAGEDGANGRGIARMEIIKGELIVSYTDGKTENLGNINSIEEDFNHEIFDIKLLSDNTYSIIGIKDTTLTNVIIPEKINGIFVTRIGANAFENNLNLQTIKIADSITIIGKSAFQNCPNLQSIEISTDSQLVYIESRAFYGCEKLGQMYIPRTTTYIGDHAFYQSGVTSVYFENPMGWNLLGRYAQHYYTYFNPIGEKEAAQMLTDSFTYNESTPACEFYAQNWLQGDVYINVPGAYYLDIGSR